MSKPMERRRRTASPPAPETSAPPTRERIVAEYAAIAFSDMRRLIAWGPDGVDFTSSALLSDNDARSVAEVSETSAGSRRLKLHDKKGALDSLARCLGMFIDRHELSGRDGSSIRLAGAPDLSRLDEAELRTLEELLAKTVGANGHADADHGRARPNGEKLPKTL